VREDLKRINQRELKDINRERGKPEDLTASLDNSVDFSRRQQNVKRSEIDPKGPLNRHQSIRISQNSYESMNNNESQKNLPSFRN